MDYEYVGDKRKNVSLYIEFSKDLKWVVIGFTIIHLTQKELELLLVKFLYYVPIRKISCMKSRFTSRLTYRSI